MNAARSATRSTRRWRWDSLSDLATTHSAVIVDGRSLSGRNFLCHAGFHGQWGKTDLPVLVLPRSDLANLLSGYPDHILRVRAEPGRIVVIAIGASTKLTVWASPQGSRAIGSGSGCRSHEHGRGGRSRSVARLLADVCPVPHLASSRKSGRVRKRALRSRSASRNTTGVLGPEGTHAMSKPTKKTSSRTERTPATLTRHEIERAGESIVASRAPFKQDITAIGILAAARDRADEAGSK